MHAIRLYEQIAASIAAWIARRWQTTGGVVLLGAITGALVAGVAVEVPALTPLTASARLVVRFSAALATASCQMPLD